MRWRPARANRCWDGRDRVAKDEISGICDEIMEMCDDLLTKTRVTG